MIQKYRYSCFQVADPEIVRMGAQISSAMLSIEYNHGM